MSNNNQVKEIDFLLLPHFKTISLHHCPVRTINTSSLSKVTHTLTKLSLCDSRLICIGDEIAMLPNLVELNLMQNHSLMSISPAIAKLQKVEILNISFCVNIQPLPLSLRKCKNLREIIAINVPISKFPSEISRNEKLKILNLSIDPGGNALRSLEEKQKENEKESLYYALCHANILLPHDLILQLLNDYF